MLLWLPRKGGNYVPRQQRVASMSQEQFSGYEYGIVRLLVVTKMDDIIPREVKVSIFPCNFGFTSKSIL